MTTTTNKGGRKNGPDLLANAASHDGNRILSQLEHGAPPLAVPRLAAHGRGGWLGTVGALLGVMLLALAWLAWDSLAQAPLPDREIDKDGATASAMARRSTPAPAAAPAPPPVPQTNQPPSPGPAAATIINEVPAAAAPAHARGTAPQKSHPGATVAAARAPTVKPSKRASVAAPAGDSDVTLLAAIVAHGQQPAPLRQEAVRDVVLRQEEEETASLLQRCRQLGLIEGMLCRARICSGRWDSDPACH